MARAKITPAADDPQWVKDFCAHPDSVDSVHDKRDLLERWPMADIIAYAMHLDKSRVDELPDRTLDQLMYKIAFARVEHTVEWNVHRGWLEVATPWGLHCFILDADGKALSSFQVL